MATKMIDDSYVPFESLKQSTPCPFAKSTILEYAPSWTEGTDPKDLVRVVVEGLRRHLSYGRERELGGYVARLPASGRTFCSDVHDFAQFVYAMGSMDASCAESLSQDIGEEGWSLLVADEPVFLNFFSSRYPRAHSKYIDCSDSFWIFFQPEYVFDQKAINRGEHITKSRIRGRFAEAGLAYDATEIDSRRKALCYVFPPSLSDSPIYWWRS